MENYQTKKNVFIIIIALLILILIIISIPYTRSLISTKIYKEINKRESILIKEGIVFEIPSGKDTPQKDWYPQMIWFHDPGGFSRYMNRNLDMTVLYSYGAFKSIFGTASYYDDKSPFYGAFYGGYAVRDMDSPSTPFGFDSNGEIITYEIESIPRYDQKYLVLPALGCNQKKIFNTFGHKIKDDVTYAGYEGWVRIDSQIKTNGPAHKRKGYHIGYLQYGLPLEPSEETKKDFSPEWFHGRMYARYFEEYEMTICLYVMSKNKKTIDACDKELLSKTTITMGN